MNFNRMYAIGGVDLMEDSFGDVWVLDITQLNDLMSRKNPPKEDIWMQFPTTGEAPGKISNHKAVAVDNTIYVYGGSIYGENPDQSLFSLDIKSGVWSKCISKVMNFFFDLIDNTCWKRWS